MCQTEFLRFKNIVSGMIFGFLTCLLPLPESGLF
jgi:hypothetical protein